MNTEPQSTSVQLPAVADLNFAATLKTTLEQALAAGVGVVVDASDVQRLGSPCLQVLLSAVKSFAQAGGSGLVLRSPSTDFMETVSALGLDQALGLTRA